MALVSVLHISACASVHPCLSHLSLHVSVSVRYFFYFHLSLLYLCLSVCSPAVVPPCSPPSVWIICLLLLPTTIVIQTSALPHSFPSALETLILHLLAPLLTTHSSHFPLLHSTRHFPITFPPLLTLRPSHLLFKTPLTTVTQSLSTTPN